MMAANKNKIENIPIAGIAGIIFLSLSTVSRTKYNPTAPPIIAHNGKKKLPSLYALTHSAPGIAKSQFQALLLPKSSFPFLFLSVLALFFLQLL